MARTNKYSSLNFNDIYEKKVISNTNANPSGTNKSHSSPSSSSTASSLTSPNKTILSNSRIHGHMLVLSRPTTPKPKPIIVPQKQEPSPKIPALTTHPATKSKKVPDQTGSEPDSISLRPQGRTGSGSPLLLSPLPSSGNPNLALSSPLPKTDRFVPPHLRPGFAGREEKPGPEFVKGGQGGGGRGRGQFASPNWYGEDGRPKSGGGYERMRRIVGEAEPVDVMNRPGSGGSRPSSSG